MFPLYLQTFKKPDVPTKRPSATVSKPPTDDAPADEPTEPTDAPSTSHSEDKVSIGLL